MQVAMTASPAPRTTANTPKTFSMPVIGAGCLHNTISATATSSKSAPNRYHRGTRAPLGAGGAGWPLRSEPTPVPEGLGSGDENGEAAPRLGRVSMSASNFRPMTGFGTQTIYNRNPPAATTKCQK